MLDKISKQVYQDSVFYSNSQDFDWKSLQDYTSSYSGNESRMQVLVAKYKTYLMSIKRYTKSDESESSYIDTDMDIIFRYMRSLPKRIRKIVMFKIIEPELTITELAKRLKCNRDTTYESFKTIRKDYPELIFFTCPLYRKQEREERQ
jgi:hypothetical protein